MEYGALFSYYYNIKKIWLTFGRSSSKHINLNRMFSCWQRRWHPLWPSIFSGTIYSVWSRPYVYEWPEEMTRNAMQYLRLVLRQIGYALFDLLGHGMSTYSVSQRVACMMGISVIRVIMWPPEREQNRRTKFKCKIL